MVRAGLAAGAVVSTDPWLYIAIALGFAIAYPFAFLANRYALLVRWKRSQTSQR